MKVTTCPNHGEQGVGLVCKHIAYAVDESRRVGFFWGDEIDTARPDGWCAQCERDLQLFGPERSDEWFVAAEFKIFCAKCWDEANAVCGAEKWASTSQPPDA